MKFNRLFLAVAICDLLALPPASAATKSYSFTDLGELAGCPYSRAYDINNKGVVVGQAIKDIAHASDAHAIIWDHEKVAHIPNLKGSDYGTARSVNDKGEVVGGNRIENYGSHGFQVLGPSQALVFTNGKASPLVPSAASNLMSNAYSINNQGQVAGEDSRRAVIWDHGSKIPLSVSSTTFSLSIAFAINNRGNAAGIIDYNRGSNKHVATLWLSKEMNSLPPLEGDMGADAFAINDKDEVVGASYAAYQSKVVFWENGKAVGLIDPYGHPVAPGVAYGINNKSQIVGYALTDRNHMHAILWEKVPPGVGPGMIVPTDLNGIVSHPPEMELIVARSINDDGQIVGEALVHDEIHAFLLTPVSATQKP